MDDTQYIRERLDKVVDTQAEHGALLARNTASLEEHMRRSDALETRIEQVSTQANSAMQLVNFLRIFGSVIMALAAIVGVWVGIK